jgi:hypothetical protein
MLKLLTFVLRPKTTLYFCSTDSLYSPDAYLEIDYNTVRSKLLFATPTGCTFRRVSDRRAICIGSTTNMPITTNGEHRDNAILVTTSFIVLRLNDLVRTERCALSRAAR